MTRLQKVHQQERLVHPAKGKVQEEERQLRKVEEEKAVCMIRPREVQQEWRRSSVAELRKQVKEHCGKDVLEEACLLELEWCTEEVVVLYLTCERYGS